MAMTDAPRPRRRPRRPLLTREAVIEAAARVMERDGYAGLTMRAIADDLGVQAPALYWYVAGKEQLESLLYDHLMDGFAFSLSGDDWADHIRQAARQLRARLHSKRDISHIVPFGFSLGPNGMTQLDAALAILRSGGLGLRDAAYAFNLLFAYVVDWSPVDPNASHDSAEPALRDSRLALEAFDPALYPNVAALAPDLTSNDPEGRFEFGLDCMIAGLERLVGRGA
jgi:TetR/AcrR family tetracycline transcriptional repressor